MIDEIEHQGSINIIKSKMAHCNISSCPFCSYQAKSVLIYWLIIVYLFLSGFLWRVLEYLNEGVLIQWKSRKFLQLISHYFRYFEIKIINSIHLCTEWIYVYEFEVWMSDHIKFSVVKQLRPLVCGYFRKF